MEKHWSEKRENSFQIPITVFRACISNHIQHSICIESIIIHSRRQCHSNDNKTLANGKYTHCVCFSCWQHFNGRINVKGNFFQFWCFLFYFSIFISLKQLKYTYLRHVFTWHNHISLHIHMYHIHIPMKKEYFW